MQYVYEEDIKKAFVKEFNKMIQNKDEIIANCVTFLEELLNTSEIEKDNEMVQESAVIAKLIEQMVMDNAKTAINQEEYTKKYEKLAKRYENIQGKINNIEKLKLSKA